MKLTSGSNESRAPASGSVRGLGPAADDCFRPNQPRMRHDEAAALLRERVKPIGGTSSVPLGDLAGRILAEAVSAISPVPSHTNAAVDGYAFSSSGYKVAGHPIALQVAGRAAAGHPLGVALAPGQAARIFTGAVMPLGADTVVMQEDVELSGEARATVTIPPGLKPGANVRKAGEDVAAGAVLFEPGHVVRPQDLAALASIGRREAICFDRLRVGIVSTGDEIRPPGNGPIAAGQVYDANSPMLGALAALSGVEVHHYGIWPDDLGVVTANLKAAAAECDVLLTSGGASMGEEDHMSAAIGAIGKRHLWQLAIKPGRPMMFGQIATGSRDTVVIGLPGNPVAVFVCFLMYVAPVLKALGGAPWPEPRRFLLPAAFDFSGRKRGRREFWRGRVTTAGGAMHVEKFARDGSGLISGLRWADGLIDIPEDCGDVAIGDPVAFIPFSEFGIVG
jgi:molybdopterin molybdotransferase